MSKQPPIPDWEILITPELYWKHFKERDFKCKLKTILYTFRRIPVWTYPAGHADYWEVAREYGRETWYSPHNIWRQAFHFLYGVIAGLFIPYYLLAPLAAANEIAEGRKIYGNYPGPYSPAKQPAIKNFLDAAVFTFGAFIGGLLWQ